MSDIPLYYTDSEYELELNLQEIRRSLIQMLDDFEQQDCKICNELKCKCIKDAGYTPNTSSETVDIADQCEALRQHAGKQTLPPHPSSLPKPEFESNSSNSQEPTSRNLSVANWILSNKPSTSNAGTPKKEKDADKEPIWNSELKASKVYSSLSDHFNTSVELFFRNYKVSQLATPKLANNASGQIMSPMPIFTNTTVPTVAQGVNQTQSKYEFNYSYFN